MTDRAPPEAQLEHWPDLRMAVRYWLDNEAVLSFTVYQYYEATGANGESWPEYLDSKPVGHRDITKASIWLSGHVKWDGCCNFRFDEQDHCMLHTCTREELVNIGVLLGRVWDLGKREIPTWGG